VIFFKTSIVRCISNFRGVGFVAFTINELFLPSSGGAKTILHKEIFNGVGLGKRKFGMHPIVTKIVFRNLYK